MSYLKTEARRWVNSDLIAIPVTLFAVAIVLFSIMAIVLGPIRGIVFSAPVWGLGIYFAVRPRRQPERIDDARRSAPGSRHRILVVANRGLENPALCEEVCRRASGPDAEVMILAPVRAGTPTGVITDDFDTESGEARGRVQGALLEMERHGVKADGHVDEDADPMTAILDGLREYPADEIVMLTGPEAGWQEAETFADRVRSEVGLEVTEVAPAGR
ncbi:MAG TPA: universal stress protein [Solirubrobacterales bacterium]|nr:universal stress protein [Solirubrobacterales bacterium]